MHVRRALLRWLAVLGLLAAVLGWSSCRNPDRIDRHYPTYAAAVEAGEARRGWLPAWVPVSAVSLYLQNDIDTNEWWLRFTLDGAAADSLRTGLQSIAAAGVRVSRPSRASWWFDGLIEQQPANDAALYADVYQGSGAPVPISTIVAFDKTSPIVYVWNVSARETDSLVRR